MQEENQGRDPHLERTDEMSVIYMYHHFTLRIGMICIV